jgi:hypothetical protein
MRVPAVVSRDLGLDQSTLLERPKDPAQISTIELEAPRDVACGGSVAMRELIEDSSLSERKVTAQMAAEGTDATRVEAVEFANGAGA